MADTAIVVALAIVAAAAIAGCGDESSDDPGVEFVPGSVDVVPRPSEVEVDAAGSVFVVDERTLVTVVRGESDARAAAELLVELLRGPFPTIADAAETARPRPRPNAVLLTVAGADAALGRDGYELTVTSDHVTLRAVHPAGFVHGVQTIRQLLPAEIELRAVQPDVSWSVASVHIRDVPRFAWRGLLIDTSRTFVSKAFLLRQLELLALYKISVLHLHLTDDQGWRLEVDAHPQLHELGSRWDAQRAPDERGGYYTKDDIREIVDRATALGITVVPEIDMPGHIVAALHAMPELACRTAPDVPRTAEEFPIIPWIERPLTPNVLCVCDERVYAVIEAVLDEVVELFPGPFVHVGGDEVARREEWEASYLCQGLIERGVVAGPDRLQAYFQKRIEDYLTARGRRMIAWDEALENEAPDTPSERLSSDAAFMFWRDFMAAPDRLYERDVVLAPFSQLYLDYPTRLERVYEFDPAPASLTAEQAAHVLGAEAAMWTGYPNARTEEGVEKGIFPRLLALAELSWTPQALRDGADFSRRVEGQRRRLDMLGVASGP
jgi:hexosaminidase